MKRQLFFIVLVFISNISVAQIGFGTTFDFCALNSSRYNPGYHPKQSIDSVYSDKWVTIYDDDDLSECERLYYEISFRDGYPGHTILGPATASYNCHGYSHSIYQGGDTCNIKWWQELCDVSFTTVQTPQKGDIAIVRDYTNPSHTNYTLESAHSSIVVNQDTLISKWGIGALTKHHKNDVIGLDGLAMGSSVYVYYRRVINNTITGPSIFKGAGVYTFDYDVAPITCTWSVEPAAMFQTSTGTGTTANLSFAIPFVYLAPKATITFTFGYGCDNHYTVKKEIDLRIPTTTISGTAVSEGFILDTNAVVTVTGTVRSRMKAKTVVPEGTKLVLNGGRMTSDGNIMWPGIEVWGDSNEPQYPYNGTYKQGVLELKNGAVIENAVCAVELWRPGYWNTTGGIVFADDAVFRNNAKSVHALYYTNHHPVNNVELPYISYFRNCEFVIDTNYLGTETFYKHVDLSHVNGIGFQGCDFQATRGIPGVAPKCMGIGAYSAGFMVDSRCESVSLPCPENDIDRCTFTGFNYGVLSVNDGNDFRSFTVRDAVFTNNRRGVYAQNTGYATILNNSFNIGNDSVCSYGVYAEGVSGFCIEENSFVPVNGVNCTTYGIGIFNSTGVNDIYKNTFQNLSCGNLAYGRNTSSSEEPQNKDLVGLTYTCNENIYNEYDFCVLKDNGTGDIATYQGSSAIPAGNTFSGSLFHFYNDGDHQVHYYYNSNASDEIPNTQMLSSVTPHATTSSNDCYSHYFPGGVRKTDEEIDALENAYDSADSICSVLKNVYNNVNAGDSTALMSQMAHYAHERAMAAGDIIRSDLNDTVADLARIRLWLGRMNDLASDRMAVSTYVHEGDFSSAMALANTFPTVYNLQGSDLLDHYDYMALLDLYRTLYNSGRNVYELTSDELAMVTDFADRGQGTSKMMAEAIMMEISDRSTMSYICPDLPIGTMDRGVKPSSLNQTDESDAIIVNVIPSPATTWVNVEYKLPEKHYDAVMTIVNMLGLKVKTVELSGTQGIITVDLRDLPAGIYGYTVRSGGYQKTGRTIITK